MLDKKHFKKIQGEFRRNERERQSVMRTSGNALHDAKRAIFAFHRGDAAHGAVLLRGAVHSLRALLAAHKTNRKLLSEGSLRAALEETVEAELYRQFLYEKKIGAPVGIVVEAEIYLAGITDLAGELVRYAIAEATEKRFGSVRRAKEAVDEIMAALVLFNLTGYLRTKYDQAKQARRRMEEIAYEVAMRGNGG